MQALITRLRNGFWQFVVVIRSPHSDDRHHEMWNNLAHSYCMPPHYLPVSLSLGVLNDRSIIDLLCSLQVSEWVISSIKTNCLLWFFFGAFYCSLIWGRLACLLVRLLLWWFMNLWLYWHNFVHSYFWQYLWFYFLTELIVYL